jgi:cation diffusion facilitator CzcD-associated flavoprotein CzcO
MDRCMRCFSRCGHCKRLGNATARQERANPAPRGPEIWIFWPIPADKVDGTGNLRRRHTGRAPSLVTSTSRETFRMSVIDRSQRFCVIGAGSSGLAAAKNLRQEGIDVDVLERNAQLGGNWCYGQPNSRVYASTHTISSKRLTEFNDFQMPGHFPNFPHHTQVFEYLQAYAAHFGLNQLIEYGAGVQRAAADGTHWQVTLESGECRRYAGVVVANGHNWDPRWPDFPGQFDGVTMHSAQYKTADVLRGRRVLVVGAGNTGCDIAVEAALHADKVFHSLRRGYHFIPKFFFGRPSDTVGEKLLRLGLPDRLRRFIVRAVLKLTVGRIEKYGLPSPDHELFATHPIINSQLPYYVAHGRITPKPNVAHLSGERVRFVDGSCEAVDLIIYATGYKIGFPFLDRQYLNWRDGKPHLYLNVFHPDYDNLFFVGLIQPDSGQFGLVDYQAQLVAQFIRASRVGSPGARKFGRQKADLAIFPTRHAHYLDTPRNLLEVEHYSYRKRMQKELRRLRAA